MGAVRLPDELQHAVERQVEAGRAESVAAFLEEAVRRLIDDVAAEAEDVRLAAEIGAADIAAGRVTTLETAEQVAGYRERMMARLREGLASEKS